jgi:hypothetical protein
MVIPVGLLGAQQLVVVEKDLNGRVITKEINEGNYAGTVLGARGIRPAFIPSILISRIGERCWVGLRFSELIDG